MNIEEIRNYCLQKKATTESLPFNDTALVFKVAGKMYALLDLENKNGINLKSKPEDAISLREKHDFIIPGYHMNKTHWNTIVLDNRINSKFLCELIDKSYDLVVSGFTKKEKQIFENEATS